jgi:radical SAM protein (TIGR01212 family)
MGDRVFYRSFSSYLRERFGEKVYRISLDAGFTCPNRDGKIGTGGCTYCSPGGSWKGKAPRLPLEEQVLQGKGIIGRRYGARKFIAYFQAYTNTYAPVETLKKIYDSVVRSDSDFVGISIGTRPDCVDEQTLELISSYRKHGLEVWIEYGLQSANDATLRLINRGHSAEDFSRAVLRRKHYDIMVSAHVIVGLPREKRDDVIRTARFVEALPVDGIKIHNLNIVRGTKVAEMYRKGELVPLALEEYAGLAVDFLEYTRPEVIVDRLVAESDPETLIEPRWSLDKRRALDAVKRAFEMRKSYQGKLVSH